MKSDRYQKLAKVYDRFYLPGEKAFQKAGLKLYPPRENIKVLDIGCGTGAQLSLYESQNCQLFGIDCSPAMLEVARRKLGGKADLRLENASHTTFNSGFFDLVLIEMALHEMESELRIEVLKEAKRVLRQDGNILLIDYAFGPYSFPVGLLGRLFVPIIEFSAGRQHFAGFRDYKKRGGAEPLISATQLSIEKSLNLHGVAAAYLLRP
jgi:ubiquinone/menaquinone biosynthesis C-methylase UbiE